MADVDHLPTTLIDVIANTIILRQTAPYLPLRSLLALSAVSRTFRDVIISAPEAWRHLDLKEVKSAIIDSSPIDVGGVSWRAERSTSRVCYCISLCTLLPLPAPHH